jgi:hypothetical protein
LEKTEKRVYIKIRTQLAIAPIDIWKELQEYRGPDAYSLSTIERWAKKFREDVMDVEDQLRLGYLVAKTTQENIDLVRRLIEEDPHSTYADLIAET